MKPFKTITSFVDTGLITSTVTIGEISIPTFASGFGPPVGIALTITDSLLLQYLSQSRKNMIQLSFFPKQVRQ